MNVPRQCPQCGKPMAEEPKWKGLWACPDSKIRLNDEPPYQYQCDGMELTEEGVEAFNAELWRIHTARN